MPKKKKKINHKNFINVSHLFFPFPAPSAPEGPWEVGRADLHKGRRVGEDWGGPQGIIAMAPPGPSCPGPLVPILPSSLLDHGRSGRSRRRPHSHMTTPPDEAPPM